MEAADLRGLCATMKSVQAVIASISTGAVYRAVCRDALAGRAVMVVAVDGTEIVGYVLAVVDWGTYWWGFPGRHPLVALEIALGRLRRRMRNCLARRRRAAVVMPTDSAAGSPPAEARSWADSSPVIAKIMCIGVRQDWCRQGVGKALYRHLFGVLRQRGVRRLDAQIDLDNKASVRLHEATGWQVRPTGDGYFATVDL
jgi:ribosomal protein S18 acetylase RimI-like enzyme